MKVEAALRHRVNQETEIHWPNTTLTRSTVMYWVSNGSKHRQRKPIVDLASSN